VEDYPDEHGDRRKICDALPNGNFSKPLEPNEDGDDESNQVMEAHDDEVEDEEAEEQERDLSEDRNVLTDEQLEPSRVFCPLM